MSLRGLHIHGRGPHNPTESCVMCVHLEEKIAQSHRLKVELASIVLQNNGLHSWSLSRWMLKFHGDGIDRTHCVAADRARSLVWFMVDFVQWQILGSGKIACFLISHGYQYPEFYQKCPSAKTVNEHKYEASCACWIGDSSS